MALVEQLFDGAIDIIGDVHGEVDALSSLLAKLGYREDGRHPNGRRLVFLGDLCDRGPDSPAVIDKVRALVERERAQCIVGNHELNLLRRDSKSGNRWYVDPDHHEHADEFARCERVHDEGRKAQWHAFFLALPVALERADLRIAHAAWEPAAIAALRASTGSNVEAYEHHERRTEAQLEAEGLEAAALAEEAAHDLECKDRPVPLLRNLALRDERYQMGNPVRVVTSGAERATERPFWANGKWRMCDRVRWWDAYTADVPVIVGHYWRTATNDVPRELSGGKPDLFAGSRHDEWVGARRNVFCVDFSVGARYRERAAGAPRFTSRLGAVRWPEAELVFDDDLPTTRLR